MKKVFLLILFIVVAFKSFAQIHVKENSFRKIEGFVMMDKSEHIDDNNVPMALIKISTENISAEERRKITFKGNLATYFDVHLKTSEIYLYLSTTATFLEIHHPDYGKTEYWLPEDLCDYCGYEMVVVSGYKTEKTVDEVVVPLMSDRRNIDVPPTKSVFVNLNFACSNTYTGSYRPTSFYGITYGEICNEYYEELYKRKGVNWYVSFMSNFNFIDDSGLVCDKDGYIDGETCYYTGNVEVYRFSILAGLSMRMSTELFLKLGLGAGAMNVAWENTSGLMVMNTDQSVSGVDIDAGIMYVGRRINASFDVVTTNFKIFELKLGLGFNFSR